MQKQNLRTCLYAGRDQETGERLSEDKTPNNVEDLNSLPPSKEQETFLLLTPMYGFWTESTVG